VIFVHLPRAELHLLSITKYRLSVVFQLQEETCNKRSEDGWAVRIIGHLINVAEHIHSPNQDERPDDSDISLIVIHSISLPAGHFGGSYVPRLFTNTLNCSVHPDFDSLKGVKVSAHLCIRRDGEVLQFVPFDKRAWHAGESRFEGRESCNDFSIGIELEGTEDSPFTHLQYQKLAQACRLIIDNYSKTSVDRIVGHSDIAPDRKTDPGDGFDWLAFRSLLQIS
jgi:AmpD protein